MTSPDNRDREFDQAKLLLTEYCFDLAGFKAGELVAIWQERLAADPNWIRAAVIEALYLGRYKAISVEQILTGWKRRGHPVRHFNSEFERVVFGPIDPTISRYASMTTRRPSELMTPTAAPPELPDTHPRPNQGAISTADTVSPPETSHEPESHTQPPVNLSTEAELRAGSDSDSLEAASAACQTAGPFSQPEPIQKFVPRPESSSFYQRLQAVVQEMQ